jgi:hypothetical protein
MVDERSTGAAIAAVADHAVTTTADATGALPPAASSVTQPVNVGKKKKQQHQQQQQQQQQQPQQGGNKKRNKIRRSARAVAPNPHPDPQRGGHSDDDDDESSVSMGSNSGKKSNTMSGATQFNVISDRVTDLAPKSNDKTEHLGRSRRLDLLNALDGVEDGIKNDDDSDSRSALIISGLSRSFSSRRQPHSIVPADVEMSPSWRVPPRERNSVGAASDASSVPLRSPFFLKRTSGQSSKEGSGPGSFIIPPRSSDNKRASSFNDLLRLLTPVYPKFFPSPFQRSDINGNGNGNRSRAGSGRGSRAGSREVSSRRSVPWILEHSVRAAGATAAAAADSGKEDDEKSPRLDGNMELWF